MLCIWGKVADTHSTREISYSQRKLTVILGRTWHNATDLDLSWNRLNLTHPKSLQEVQRFGRLVMLNLSGNYLPLLERNHLSSLSALQVLDLSRCQLAGIENGAFRGLPKLQTLLLRGNKLKDPLPIALQDLRALSFLDLHGNVHIRTGPPDWLKGVRTVFWPGSSDFVALGNTSEGHMQNLNILRQFQRKLLADFDEHPTTANINSTEATEEHPSHSWQYLVAVLVAAISISIVIAIGAKCKLFHHYVASYRHALLPEDTASQCDPMGLEVGFSGQGMPGRGPYSDAPTELDDDDGFIEDNYIQACERERAERAAEELKDEDEDDDIEFTIG
ncbi:hypothetical protein AAFF_G00074070 [Aldrovandia affinis]|uniref:Leucine-rich repeat-containing protein 19 n=1 Tax=Aldrovandia affinis TaxID=143900 RepID=A0AAD7RY88_9TELE|nr:hypothetical protein AAFF_G00074070 [Aldrovandia affinis]